MPWQPDGTFLRVNPDFSGATVWSQDQQAPIKIIATRHDFHDEDLAKGIADCVNLDGYNSMRADLNMGGFNIVNVGAGGNTLATVNQVPADLTYAGDVLSMLDGDGNLIDSVTIPSGGGGGGSGTVTSITIGEGLAGANNPITVDGDIALATLKAGNDTYSYPSSITVDKHGRVTQVVPGVAPGGTNLSITDKTATTLKLNSSTQSNGGVVVPAVTTSKAGLMTAADKQSLNTLNALTIPEIEAGAMPLVAAGVTVDADSVLNWYRIGQLIHFYGHFDWSNHLNNANELVISGLPYEAVNASGSTNAFITGNYVANQYINGFDNSGTDPSFTQGLYVPEGTFTIKLGAFYGKNSVNPAPGTVQNVLLNSLNFTFGFFDFSGWYVGDLTKPAPNLTELGPTRRTF